MSSYQRLKGGMPPQQTCPCCGASLVDHQGASVDLQRNVAIIDSTSYILRPKEAEILYALLGAMPRALAREHLINAVWGANSDTSDRTVDTHIKRLRGSLKGSRAQITTHYRVGYSVELNDVAR